MMAKEAPGVLVILLLLHEDADAAAAEAVADVVARGHVFFPDDAEEERAGRVHDGDVGQVPVFVVFHQRVDDAQEEGVLRGGAHGVVGDAGWHRFAHPGRVREEGVETAVAALYGGDVSGMLCWTADIAERGLVLNLAMSLT